MQDFKQLKVWQKSWKLSAFSYQLSVFLLTAESLWLRANGSIPTNIAEGCGRGSDAELARFLQIAMGSASELEYQLLLSKQLGYFQLAEHYELEKSIQEVKRMLASFLKKLKADS